MPEKKKIIEFRRKHVYFAFFGWEGKKTKDVDGFAWHKRQNNRSNLTRVYVDEKTKYFFI